MAIVTINGTVKHVGQTQQISERFSKREVVITETVGQYPQHIPVEFANDKTSLLDDLGPGDQVTVSCYVNGREYTDRNTGQPRYFLSLRGDRIEKAGATPTPPPAPPYPGSAATTPPPPSISDMPEEKEDDLPF